MNTRLAPYLRVILPLILQVVFFQYVSVGVGWWYLGFHLLGILLLPLQRSGLSILLFSAVFGAAIDFTCHGGGLFMSSAVLMGLFIPIVNRLLAPREGYEVSDQPTISLMGSRWFLVRTFLLLFIHNTWMFSIEAGRWDLLLLAWGKATASTLLTTVIFALTLLLTQRKTRSR